MSKQFKTTKTEHFPVISSGLRVACDRESVMLLLKREDGRAGICVRMTPEASRKLPSG
jgi:hypothetical protein